MNEKFYEALENCLQAIETGADIESVLERYPQMAEELRPIIKASFDARSLATTSVPEDAMRRGRARVLGHAAGMRESARNSRRSIFAFPRLATSLAFTFLFLISGTGLVYASSAALPGDNLYSVKRTWEDVRLLLAFDSEYREELEDEFEVERLHEVDELLMEGRHETITFAGVVTEQNGDQWMVSGIAVQITLGSNLPGEPVTIGASVMVEGSTNIDGFVEADRVDLLDPGISLSPSTPVEIESSEPDGHDEASEVENGTNDNQDDLKIENSDDQSDSSDDEGYDDSQDGSSDSSSNDEGESEDKNDSNNDEGIADGSGGDD